MLTHNTDIDANRNAEFILNLSLFDGSLDDVFLSTVDKGCGLEKHGRTIQTIKYYYFFFIQLIVHQPDHCFAW